ncbi:MAG: YraN family protein [Candidatus Daviesbacteria bacterium]|nr:YraN family protein [Candidatus Daviesbacteria bacterium]
MNNKITGNYGEDLAVKYLQKLGYKILNRNYRIRGGEIDIVAKDRETLVFVEVKTRYSHEFGDPAEAMTYFKMKALLKTAQFYLMQFKLENMPYRLDFISVDFSDDKDNPKIELLKNITS